MDDSSMEVSDNDKTNIDDYDVSQGSFSNIELSQVNNLSGIMESLCLDNRSSSPIPSTSTGITDYNSGRLDYPQKTNPDAYNHSSPSSCSGNESTISLPNIGVKRPHNRMNPYFESKKPRTECASAERRRRYRRRREYQGNDTSDDTEQVELTARSDPQLPLSLSSTPLENSNCYEFKPRKIKRRKLRPKRRRNVATNTVRPCDGSNRKIREDSDHNDSGVPSYQTCDHTEHETSDSETIVL